MRAKHFEIYELVYPELFKIWGDKAWQFINPALIRMQDQMREQAGVPIYVNTYKWGGDRKFSGLRPLDGIGAKLSIHKFGGATDSITRRKTADEIRAMILEKYELFQEVGCLELGINWIHMDVRNNPNSDMLFVNSKGSTIGYVNKRKIIENPNKIHLLVDGKIDEFNNL